MSTKWSRVEPFAGTKHLMVALEQTAGPILFGAVVAALGNGLYADGDPKIEAALAELAQNLCTAIGDPECQGLVDEACRMAQLRRVPGIVESFAATEAIEAIGLAKAIVNAPPPCARCGQPAQAFVHGFATCGECGR